MGDYPNFPINGNPWAQSVAPLAPPVYSPGSMGGGDPMNMAMMLFGIPLLQKMAGPGQFIPNLMPGQQLADQLMAAQYQNVTRDATFAMAGAGNNAVTRKVQSFARLAVGGETSPLNAEQAANIAGVINNPIMKQLIGSAIGPDALEGVFFGRKGDPAALASAVNRVGFFRRDPLGGERMTAQSLEDLTKSTYANLYGSEDSINHMRGFTAGQTGQLMEHLFQRGELPQSLGALSPAERVAAISRGPRDDATMERLSEEFARRQLSASTTKFGPNNRTFAEATPEEQKDILSTERPKFRAQLEKTLGDIDTYREADHRAKSPQDIEKELAAIEKMPEFGMLAANVEGGRVSDKLKEFTGSLAAIREIFGDSGRTNAPVPELLAALEHLTQGSAAQLSPAKVESTLRQMRNAAQAAGIKFEQLAGISAQIGAQGDMLGLARPVSMQNTLNSVTMASALRDSGAFSRPVFGAINQAEAGQAIAESMQRGDASPVGRTLAAMARAVQTNSAAHGSNDVLQGFAKAYAAGKETFEVGGKTYNIAEIAGMGGVAGLHEFARKHNLSVDEVRTLAADPGTQEFLKAGYSFKAQTYQLQRNMAAEALSGITHNRLTAESFQANAGALGLSAEQMREQTHTLAGNVDLAIAKTLMEETGGMSSEERTKHMLTRMPELVRQIFKADGMSDPDADARTALVMPALLGADEGERVSTMNQYIARANQFSILKTGKSLAAQTQMRSPEAQRLYDARQAVAANRAERQARMALGHESSFAQRIGEALDSIDETGKIDYSKIAKMLADATSKSELAAGYAPELAGGINAALEEYNAATVNGKEITQAAAQSQAADPAARAARAAAEQNLKTLAGVDASTKIVTADEVGTRLEKLEDETVKQLYTKNNLGRATNKADQIAALKHLPGIGAAVGFAADEKTTKDLELLARQRIGLAKGGTDAERNANAAIQQRTIDYLRAVSQAELSGLTASALALADVEIEAAGLDDTAGRALKDEIGAALTSGDPSAMAALESKISDPERYKQLKTAGAAYMLKLKENLALADQNLEVAPGVEGKAERDAAIATGERTKKQIEEAEKAAAASRKPARTVTDRPQTSTELTDAVGEEYNPAAPASAAPPGSDITRAAIRAETVQLAAAKVVLSDDGAAPAAPGSSAAAASTAAALNAPDATKKLPTTADAGKPENAKASAIALAGELRITGMNSAIIAAVGRPPIGNGDGAQVFTL